MHDWWIKDRIEQGQFKVEWSKGKHSLSDYFSKKHPSSHHKAVRPIYNYEPGVSPTSLQGCIEILDRAHSANNSKRTVISRLDTEERAIKDPNLRLANLLLDKAFNH